MRNPNAKYHQGRSTMITINCLTREYADAVMDIVSTTDSKCAEAHGIMV